MEGRSTGGLWERKAAGERERERLGRRKKRMGREDECLASFGCHSPAPVMHLWPAWLTPAGP